MSRPQTKPIFVAPVSGGYFPNQVAILRQLFILKIFPEIMLGASGGAVSSYIALASDFEPQKLLLVCNEISSSTFIKRWIPSPLPSEAFGFFAGAIYNSSRGGIELLQRHLTPITSVGTEIWVSSFNKGENKTRLFCNRGRYTTIVDESKLNLKRYQMMEPGYADGDIEYIGSFTIASASIPGIVPSQLIDENNYVDGGIHYASPLTPMSDIFDKEFRCIYINCINIEGTKGIDKDVNCIHNTKWSITNLINGSINNDRNKGISILELLAVKKGKKVKVETYHVSSLADKYKTYLSDFFIEVYPKENVELNLFKFNGEDVVNLIEQQKGDLHVRAWYI